jgi:hypothetical protein
MSVKSSHTCLAMFAQTNIGLLCLVASGSNVAAPVQCQKWGRKKKYSGVSRQWLIESFCIWTHGKIALPLL